MKIDVGQQRRNHRALRCAFGLPVYRSVFAVSRLQPFADEAQYPLVPNPLLDEDEQGFMGYRVEESLYVCVEYPPFGDG